MDSRSRRQDHRTPRLVRIVLGAVPLLIALAGAGGCKKLSASLGSGGSTAPAASASADSAPDIGTKMNGYVECLNTFAENVLDSENFYYDWAPKDQPPSEKTKDIKGIVSTFIEPKQCADRVNKSNALPPKLPALEQLGTRFVAALEHLRPLLDEARKYYENREYKIDKFVKARQLHQELVNAFDEYDASLSALGKSIDVLQNQEDARVLVKLEKTDGRKFPFLVRSIYVQAKAMTALISKPWAEIQLPTLSQAFTQLDSTVSELVAYRDAHGEEARRISIQNFVQDSETFVRLTRSFMHRVEDKKPFSKDELFMANDSPRQINRQYNSIVGSFNNQSF